MKQLHVTKIEDNVYETFLGTIAPLSVSAVIKAAVNEINNGNINAFDLVKKVKEQGNATPDQLAGDGG